MSNVLEAGLDRCWGWSRPAARDDTLPGECKHTLTKFLNMKYTPRLYLAEINSGTGLGMRLQRGGCLHKQLRKKMLKDR